jgi:hypothetical protein
LAQRDGGDGVTSVLHIDVSSNIHMLHHCSPESSPPANTSRMHGSREMLQIDLIRRRKLASESGPRHCRIANVRPRPLTGLRSKGMQYHTLTQCNLETMDCADSSIVYKHKIPTPGGQDSAQQRRDNFFLQRKVSSAYVTAELRCPVRGASCTLKVESTGPRFPTLASKTEDLCIAIACRHKLSVHTQMTTN